MTLQTENLLQMVKTFGHAHAYHSWNSPRMLHITQSQRIELLLAAMQDFWAEHPLGVLEPQQVIVPSHGLGIWLRFQLASLRGISARLNTDFLTSYQWQLYSRVLGGDVPKSSPFARQIIQWRLFGYLLDVLAQPDQHVDAQLKLKPLLDKVAAYPAMRQQRLLWKMAEQIAGVFANYVLYRADWLKQWGNGQPIMLRARLQANDPNLPAFLLDRYEEMQGWQQFLWQHLFHELYLQREDIAHQFWQVLKEQPALRQRLPRALTVFSVLQLPPIEFQFLRQLAEYVEIHFLHYNPSQEYWADSVDPLWLKQFELKNPKAAGLRESRHPLLTRLGKQAREIFAMLVELAGNDEGVWQDLFPATYPNTLLGNIQRDVLNLEVPADHSVVLSADDQSIQIHSCHSTLRQLEVLQEQLLQWFAQDKTRLPSDVLVLAPNLDEIAPLITTVFRGGAFTGSAETSANTTDTTTSAAQHWRLPVNITGITRLDAAQLWQALTGRFSLLDGRFTIETFLDWLSLDDVQQIYALSREDVQRLAELLTDAGFRRGFDAPHLQASLDQQDHDTRFTLQFAVQRLLLGMVMPVQAIHAHILPYQQVDRQDFELIATLAQIQQDLTDRRDVMQQKHSLSTWLGFLREELHGDFVSVLNGNGGKGVQQALNGLEANIELTQNAELNLPLRFVLDEIQQILDQAPPGAVPSGRITFSKLGTLRPIPYKLIVMLNLDAGVFPSREYPNTFDLMSILPAQRGDRSRQVDDQGAFLDGLLLAQQACWMFYNGHDVNDIQPRQPAGPLQELIDFVALKLVDESAMNQLLHAHTLVPFDSSNFQPPTPQGLKSIWSVVAHQLQQAPVTQPWLNTDLPRPELTVLSFDRVIRQLCNPAAFFLSQSRIQQPSQQDIPNSFEPLGVNALESYFIRDWHQQQSAQQQELLQDRLPIGHAAQAYWKKSIWEAARNRQRLLQFGPAESALTEQPLQLGPWQLQVTVPMQPDCSLWLSQFASGYKGKRLLRYWLEHLAWQVVRQTSADDVKAQRGQRVVVLNKSTVTLFPVEASWASKLLLQWLEIWQQAAQTPWVLPPDLALSDDGVTVDEDGLSEGYIKNEAKLLQHWLHGAAFSIVPIEEQEDCIWHRDWQFILRGLSEEAAAALLQHHLALALPLYEAIKQLTQVEKA